MGNQRVDYGRIGGGEDGRHLWWKDLNLKLWVILIFHKDSPFPTYFIVIVIAERSLLLLHLHCFDNLSSSLPLFWRSEFDCDNDDGVSHSIFNVDWRQSSSQDFPFQWIEREKNLNLDWKWNKNFCFSNPNNYSRQLPVTIDK